MKPKLVLVAVLAVAARVAHGEPPAPEPASSSGDVAPAATEGEVIVVTGTRSEVPRSASPILTDVIDRTRLEESGVQTVSEALTLRPGLWIDRGVAGTRSEEHTA